MYHLDNFGTNLTSATSASDTTSPVDSVPSIAAPFWVAFDATNINGHYEVKLITSKTATNILHSALSYDHTTAEEVRIVNPALEFDALSTGWQTAPGTWTYSSADSPTFVFTTSVDLSPFIGVGTRIKLTQTTVKYFIVTAISGTTVTVYGGTDYTLANAAITSPFFSLMKAPIGFPLDPTKWTFTVISDTTERSQASPVQDTVYNPGSLSGNIPIGVWFIRGKACLYVNGGTNPEAQISLSTANNSISDSDFTRQIGINGTGIAVGVTIDKLSPLVLASKTTYYLVAKVANTSATDLRIGVSSGGDAESTIVKAICAYL